MRFSLSFKTFSIYSGLGLINPTECASRFYENSVKLTNKLKNAIIAKQDLIDYTNRTGRAEISGSNRKHAKEALEIVYSRSENEMKRTLDLLQPKGTSAWLTCLPSREQNFYMNRRVPGCAVSDMDGT